MLRHAFKQTEILCFKYSIRNKYLQEVSTSPHFVKKKKKHFN